MARRVGSVRARATLASVLVVAVASGLGAFGLVVLLRSSLQEGVETTASAQLNDVVALLRLGQLPAQLPAGRGDNFTQVVAANGRVLATSATLLGTEPISRLRPGEEGTVIHRIPALSDDEAHAGSEHGSDSDGPYLLLGRTLPAPPFGAGAPGPVTVYVAGSLHPVAEATTTVELALAGGLPVLLALVGALVWIFVGRALRPVESIRAEVADISGQGLHRRVPEPDSDDEVARLARTMNEMLDRLEASASNQRRFVADASHELRSPLAVLQAVLEVALAHPGDSPWPAVAADALDEARRLQRLVEELLTLARAEQRSTSLRSEAVDLDEIILRGVSKRRVANPAVSIDLHQVSGGRVLGAPDQLARVVDNLIDNAQRHARRCVTVALSTLGDTVVLTVADDGPGIAREDRERVFERFTRLDEARSPHDGGTGLGLAITRETVVAHGGSIEVADSPVGACMVVRLPASDAVEPGPAGSTGRRAATPPR